ncbi:MAG TPA: Hpt domain-containing protein [Devosiaceae bacterium]|jgi:HPt (histidine-containing phosphotransfer) domain-containing protein|nr:Hpt domain-containing protein [Devosiaceae bacterium]
MVQSTAARRPVDDAQSRQRHRPIDMMHLGRQALGDPGLEGEILRLFDTMSRTYFERLESSTSVEQLLQHLHTLKGAAAGVGAFGIADLARATEEELRAGAPVNPERIDDLGMAVHECSAYIATLLEGELA